MSAAQFISTRDAEASCGFSAAVLSGLAPDGGLFVPLNWPAVHPERASREPDLEHLATRVLAPFLVGDALAPSLEAIDSEAFNFPVPLVPLKSEGRLSVLELFHGPTAAFKDFGARFLAAALARIPRSDSRPLQILVATSGDTGGAVAAAFHGQPGVQVSVLFPKGLVSATQERQLTCWDGNVRSFAVRGTFDDCQRLVKQAFADSALRERLALSSANSINLGRLLPQTVYYASASLAIWREYRQPACFIIPSGNLGNAVACLWAREFGLPIAEVILAHNANRTVPDYLASGEWIARPSVPTLASAMDVGDPSNMERLHSLYPDVRELRRHIEVEAVDDEHIRRRIRAGLHEYGQIWCPHTAVAAEAYERLSEKRRNAARWVIVSTAHPGKFREIVEPLIRAPVPMPESLAELFARPTACTEIEADLAALRAALI